MMMMCCWDPFVGVSSGESEAIDGNSAFGGVSTVTLSPLCVCWRCSLRDFCDDEGCFSSCWCGATPRSHLMSELTMTLRTTYYSDQRGIPGQHTAVDLRLLHVYSPTSQGTYPRPGWREHNLPTMPFEDSGATACSTSFGRACDVTGIPTYHASHNRRKRGASRQQTNLVHASKSRFD
jgi:hypothetical protein